MALLASREAERDLTARTGAVATSATKYGALSTEAGRVKIYCEAG